MAKVPITVVIPSIRCPKMQMFVRLRIEDTGLPLLTLTSTDVVADIPSSAVSILVYIDCYGSRQDYCYWTVKGELHIPGNRGVMI